MASAGLRRIVCVPPRVARDPGIPARSNFAAIGKSSDRECSKRGISLTSGARTNPSQGQLDCAGANIDARLSRRGSGVWFNRRDSKSREPLWLRGFESPPLRHTVCTVYLQSGDGGKSARDVALLRSMRTGESHLGADSHNSMGVFSTRRKYGSLHGWSGFRSSIASKRCMRRDSSRSRARLAAPTIRAAGRSD
jgi:hypothetical protein